MFVFAGAERIAGRKTKNNSIFDKKWATLIICFSYKYKQKSNYIITYYYKNFN